MAALAHINLLAVFVCISLTLGQGQICEKQSDCAHAQGLRCQYKVGKGVRVPCELKPYDVNKKCRCKKGCLKCNGGEDGGFSIFIAHGSNIKTGCGINRCGCANPITNEIWCNLAACVGQQWTDHCNV